MPSRPRAGGQANLQGIHYQLVRSLFQATQVLRLKAAEGSGAIPYLLVVEPADGGDLRLEGLGSVAIEQAKTRSRRTWSLSELIDKVLPDLCRAYIEYRGGSQVCEVRFVTDGKSGQWKEAESFFRELGGMEFAPESLDDSRILRANAPKILTQLEGTGQRLTRKGLFRFICGVLVGSEEPGADQERVVWELLGRFQLVEVDGSRLRADVESTLRGRISRSEDIENILHGMLGALLELGRTGEPIAARELLARYGLADVDLGDRIALVSRASRVLETTLRGLGYVAEQDVRSELWGKRPEDSPPADWRPLVFCGESGQGKSWALFALAQSLARQGRLVVLVKAVVDRRNTCRQAAAVFCHEIWGVNAEVPLERLCEMLKASDPANSGYWLDLIVDGVSSPDLAQELASYDWGAKGIRLYFSWTTPGDSLEPGFSALCQLSRVSDFSTRELHDYLHIRLGDRARTVYYSDRSILHRPILARIFCDLATDEPLPPENEFHLLARYWSRFYLQRPLAAAALVELAAEAPDGRAYPWTMRTLGESGIDEAAVLHFAERGLLRWSQDGRSAELWHDRLLSWAMAEGWATGLKDRRQSLEELVARLHDLRHSTDATLRWGQRWLADALLDVLWILLDPNKGLLDSVVEILETLRPEPEPEWLAAVGERVVPALLRLVEARPVRRTLWMQALREIASPEVSAKAGELLLSGDLETRLAGAEILSDHPAVEALDGLWALRCQLERQEPKNLHAIHGIVGEALISSSRHATEWVRRAIQRSDPAAEPFSELVFLLPRMEDGHLLWLELRETIFAKIPPKGERAIAVCLESFQDRDYLDWLRERVQREDGHVGPAARRALFLLDPGRVPDQVDQGGYANYSARGWWLAPHLNADSDTAEAFIHDEVARSGDPWQVAWSLLSGFEDRIRPETLDLLLDALVERIEHDVSRTREDNSDPLWHPFSFLAKTSCRRLIERFEARKGQRLELALADWLCTKGPNDGRYHRHREGRALEILVRIGGDELARVVNAWLEQGRTFWGLGEAIEVSVVRHNDRTADLLLAVAMRDDVEGSDFPLAQRQAVGALATIGRTDLATRGAMKWSMRLSWEGVDLLGENRPSQDDLRPVLHALRESGEPEPAIVFTLGLGRREEDVGILRQILDRAKPGSELARSCLMGLYVIGDKSAATEERFLGHLVRSETEYICTLGLLQLRTTSSFAALKKHLERLERDRLSSSDIAVLIAVNLLQIEEIRLEVAEQLWLMLDRHRVVFIVQDDFSAFAALQLPEVDDWLYDLSLGESYRLQPSAQVGAIRALVARDPERAFEAAVRMVRPGSANREEAPRLLLEIDGSRALPLVRTRLEEDDDVLLLAAIGENMQATGFLPSLLAWLREPSARLREGACIAAELAPWNEDLASSLHGLLYDGDWYVRNAANRSLGRLRQAYETDRLAEALIAEADADRRWRLLHIVRSTANPGLWRRQPWLVRLWQEIPLAMRQWSSGELEKRRKELMDQLKRRKRRE